MVGIAKCEAAVHPTGGYNMPSRHASKAMRLHEKECERHVGYRVEMLPKLREVFDADA